MTDEALPSSLINRSAKLVLIIPPLFGAVTYFFGVGYN